MVKLVRWYGIGQSPATKGTHPSNSIPSCCLECEKGTEKGFLCWLVSVYTTLLLRSCEILQPDFSGYRCSRTNKFHQSGVGVNCRHVIVCGYRKWSSTLVVTYLVEWSQHLRHQLHQGDSLSLEEREQNFEDWEESESRSVRSVLSHMDNRIKLYMPHLQRYMPN